MAGETISPNMNLPIPGVGITDGPQYAIDLNACLEIIDSHDHTPGYGVPITVAGLDINADLSIGINNITTVRSTRFVSQASPIAGILDLNAIYASGGNLYFNDGNGNQIQITNLGGVAGTPGAISNLVSPASAAWVAADNTFVWSASPGVGASMDSGTLIVRYPGFYPTPSGNYVAIQAPTTLSVGYALTLPVNLPLSSGALLTSSVAGILSYTNVDSATIDIIGDQLVVQSNGLVDGITTQVTAGKIATRNMYMSHQWQLNGPYSNISVPASEVDGYLFFPFDAEIIQVWIYNAVAGTGGTTEFDVKKASSPAGAFSTILSTTGKITSAAVAEVWTDSGAVVGAQTGVTKPVLSSADVNAGDAIRIDILTVMSGPARDCGVLIQYVPR